jgi:hypothetical protein
LKSPPEAGEFATLAAGTEPLGEAELPLTNNFSW